MAMVAMVVLGACGQEPVSPPVMGWGGSGSGDPVEEPDGLSGTSTSGEGGSSGGDEPGSTGVVEGSSSGLGSTGESSTGEMVEPACVLPSLPAADGGLGYACLDVVGYSDLCEGEPVDCFIALGRLFGSGDAGSWAHEIVVDESCGEDMASCPPDVAQSCSEIRIGIECGLYDDETVADCVALIGDDLPPAVVEGLCQRVVG